MEMQSKAEMNSKKYFVKQPVACFNTIFEVRSKFGEFKQSKNVIFGNFRASELLNFSKFETWKLLEFTKIKIQNL